MPHEFLDSRGLHNLKEDDLGPIYGRQWNILMHLIQIAVQITAEKE